MVLQDLQALDSTVQEAHECLGASAQESQLGKDRRAALVAGHILTNIAVAVLPIVITVTLSALAIAAFVGGYVAALR